MFIHIFLREFRAIGYNNKSFTALLDHMEYTLAQNSYRLYTRCRPDASWRIEVLAVQIVIVCVRGRVSQSPAFVHVRMCGNIGRVIRTPQR